MKRLIFLLSFTISGLVLQAQRPVISGFVSDAATGDPLAGVNIFYSKDHGVTSDADGFYSISTETGKLRIQYSFIGYHTEFQNLNLSDGDQITIDVQMTEQAHLLDELVISASRYEQKISDVIVSMEVISAATVENTHTLSVETALQQVSGVMFLGNQVSIRSGNGYSYGVGSRVLLLLDDMPMLTGAGGQAKWDFVPLENLRQIEVLKGASSVLYGSSALNGVINIRTAHPGEKPETNLLVYSGVYGQPRRREIAWWGNTQPFYSGLRLAHSQRIGNLDLVAGANAYSDKGYRENEREQYIRVNLNTRYRSQKVSGLSGGVNANAMFSQGGGFLLWLDGDSGVYRASPAFDQTFKNTRFNLDPHITYHTPNNSRHTLKGRIFKVTYNNNDTIHNYDDSYFAEYQYLKRWENDLSLTAGASSTFIQSHSNLFGNVKHVANNKSIYLQVDKRIKQWSFTLGGRYEWHSINNINEPSKPLVRAGINYQLGAFTFLRTSFGQGFRYPSIAEKFAATQVGALKIFPNTALRPEYGWNAEFGIKHGFTLGQIQGYADAAIFWTEYQDMIEFTFGQHYPEGLSHPTLNDFFNYTGFKAYNISNARIAGFEINFIGQGKSGPFSYSFNAGYTFTDPIDKDFGKRELNTMSTNRNILKYRFYHGVKMGFDATYRKFSTGLNIDYHSHIINIDLAFEDSLRVHGVGLPIFILPGMREYREANNTGNILFNWRFAWDASEAIRLSFFINNLFNREYMTRPAEIGPPRTFAMQLAVKL